MKYLVWWSYEDVNTKKRSRDWKYVKDSNTLIEFVKDISSKHEDDLTFFINYIDIDNVAPMNQFHDLLKCINDIKNTISNSSVHNDDLYRIADKDVRCYDRMNYWY